MTTRVVQWPEEAEIASELPFSEEEKGKLGEVAFYLTKEAAEELMPIATVSGTLWARNPEFIGPIYNGFKAPYDDDK